MEEHTLTDLAGPETPATGAPALPPLGVAGVVLTKAQVLDALRPYIPNIADFSPLPDGQHFYILFGPTGQPR